MGENKTVETFTAEQLAEKVGEARNDFLRKKSKEWGVDLFDAEKEKAFFEGKVDKSVFEEINKKYTDAEAKLGEYTELTGKFSDLQIENQLLMSNVKLDKIQHAKKLISADIAEGKELDEAVKGLLETTPEWINKPGERLGANLNHENSAKTDTDKWLEKRGY